MKLTVEGLGTVEGTEDEVSRLIARLTKPNSAVSQLDSAALTPGQRVVFDEVAKHPHGAHSSAVAEATGLSASVANSRLNYITQQYPHLLQRVSKGTYKVVK